MLNLYLGVLKPVFRSGCAVYTLINTKYATQSNIGIRSNRDFWVSFRVGPKREVLSTNCSLSFADPFHSWIFFQSSIKKLKRRIRRLDKQLNDALILIADNGQLIADNAQLIADNGQLINGNTQLLSQLQQQGLQDLQDPHGPRG